MSRQLLFEQLLKRKPQWFSPEPVSSRRRMEDLLRPNVDRERSPVVGQARRRFADREGERAGNLRLQVGSKADRLGTGQRRHFVDFVAGLNGTQEHPQRLAVVKTDRGPPRLTRPLFGG